MKVTKKSLYRMLAPVAVVASLSVALQTQAGTQNVMMQGFHWESHQGANGQPWWELIENNAWGMANAGFTHVWFPPASDAGSDEGYLPRQLDNLNSQYGSSTELSDAVWAVRNNNMQPIADVVVNHRVGCTDWADFCSPFWDTWYVVANDEWPGGPKSGNYDTGDGFHAGRDLDHASSTVRNSISYWMNNTLKGVGFTGWRFDYVKGFSAGYVGEYAANTSPSFCVGELWDDLDYNNVNAHRQQLMDWINGTGNRCKAFDFTTKGLLNKALWDNEYWRLQDSNGSPAGAIGWWPAMSVTFVDNHDTGPSRNCSEGQNHWPVPCSDVMEGYAYILTHPGVPMVYWAHYYDWNLKNDINALINIRKSMGIQSESPVSIARAETGLYAAYIGSNVAMKIGPNSWSPGSGWSLATSGNNYAVWTK